MRTHISTRTHACFEIHKDMIHVLSSWYNFEPWQVRLLYVSPVHVALHKNEYLAINSSGFWYNNFRISIIELKNVSRKIYDYITSNFYSHQSFSHHRRPSSSTLMVWKEDGTIKLLVYRKKTHTDQYLNFSSHHPLDKKLGVIKTLLDRRNNIVT